VNARRFSRNGLFSQNAQRAGFVIAAIALIFGVWNAVIWIFGLQSFVLPTPQSAISAVAGQWSTLAPLTWQTVKETAEGFFVGAAIGFVLAVGMSALRPVQRLIYPALIGSQAVPIVAIAAPLVILFGFGALPKLIIVAWCVFFPVVVSVLDGLAHIDQDLVNLARVLGARRVREFIDIRLPATLSPLFSGLKIGATYAVTGAVIGEWTASSQQGLGTFLLSANSSLNAALVFGVTLLLTAIGVLSFLLVMAVESVATPWRSRSTAPGTLRRLGVGRFPGQAPSGAAGPGTPEARRLASTRHEQ
jgi:ABC-type nitrate/sulfonate/bicarbonate transport system permease component